MFKKISNLVLVVCFFLSSLLTIPQAHADLILNLPAPGTLVSVSTSFTPALIKGITVHKDNPFLFNFIVDPGQSKVSQDVLKEESDHMIKYFFASLSIPDKDVWVNLSPYEKDRMIPRSLGLTIMGRDLLAQDYLLKQLAASLIYPQQALGKTFWNRVYSKAQQLYGTTQIPIDTFNKVWIIPQRVGIYEHNQTAYIVDAHLKVMLEEDYLSLTKHNAINSSANQIISFPNVQIGNPDKAHFIASNIIRQIILPEIEKEVNEDKNFATLRQIFYAQALAVWFKQNLKQSLLNRVYANKGIVKGLDENNLTINEAIYHQYLKAYKKGVFNYIKDDAIEIPGSLSKEQGIFPRKYFSGGYFAGDFSRAMIIENLSPKELREEVAQASQAQIATVVLEQNSTDAAILAKNVATANTAMLKNLKKPADELFERLEPIYRAAYYFKTYKGDHLTAGLHTLEASLSFEMVAKEDIIDRLYMSGNEDPKVLNFVKGGGLGLGTVARAKAIRRLDIVHNVQLVSITHKEDGNKYLLLLGAFAGPLLFRDEAMKVQNENRSNEKSSVLSGRVARAFNGGIDLSQEGSAIHVEKDGNDGVKVDVNPALIARVEREGIQELDPVIINMRPADLKSLFGVAASI